MMIYSYNRLNRNVFWVRSQRQNGQLHICLTTVPCNTKVWCLAYYYTLNVFTYQAISKFSQRRNFSNVIRIHRSYNSLNQDGYDDDINSNLAFYFNWRWAFNVLYHSELTAKWLLFSLKLMTNSLWYTYS